MHNLHLIRVIAESGEEAVRIAENRTCEWGTENNWRSFGGAVSKSGVVYKHDKNTMWVPEDKESLRDLAREMIPKPIDREWVMTVLKSIDTGDWFMLSYKASQEGERLKLPIGGIDIWDDEFMPFNFSDFGLTELCGANEDGELWIVFMDMHS